MFNWCHLPRGSNLNSSDAPFDHTGAAPPRCAVTAAPDLPIVY